MHLWQHQLRKHSAAPLPLVQDAVFRGAGVEEDSQPSGALERFKKRRIEG